jgi:hypothetical protein
MTVRVGLAFLATLSAGCGDPYAGAGPLLAEQALLTRELEGLRASAERLDRGVPILPEDDVLIAIDESFIQGLVTARLPMDIAVPPYMVRLTSAEVGFGGAPTVRLRGTVTRGGLLTLDATLGLIGALTDITIDTSTSTLRAVITADHLDIERASGLEALLSRTSLDDVASLLREALADELPTVEIPIRVQQTLDVAAITDGPVRVDSAQVPINATVSRVVAADSRLWISLRVEVGSPGGSP